MSYVQWSVQMVALKHVRLKRRPKSITDLCKMAAWVK